MLNDQLKSQLQQLLQLMEGDVVLSARLGTDDKSKELKELLDEVAAASSHITIEEKDLKRTPSFTVEKPDEDTGIAIIKRAIEEPLRQIVANAGKEGAVVVQKVRESKGNMGYNARHDRYEDLVKAGVVDPAKVTRVALENAASIAGMFLTTECVITDIKKDEPMPQMPMGGGMGGMM